MRKLKIFTSILGILILAADVYLTHKGSHLCPFEGCKVVTSSRFSSLCGVSLNYWGLLFFLVALIFSSSEFASFLWSSLGLGFAVYMVILQIFVIGKICQLCLFVEILVLVLFFTSLRAKSFRHAVSLVLIGFLGVHFLYTFPPASAGHDSFAVWKGKGIYDVEFFFDPECPACYKVYEKLKESKSIFKSIHFRCAPVHRESFELGIEFYRLCEKLGPWKAFELVHGKKNGFSLGLRGCFSPLKSVLLRNLDLLRFTGVDAVPVVVLKHNRSYSFLVGYKAFSEWLESEKASSGGFEEELFTPLGGVCTPKRCE